MPEHRGCQKIAKLQSKYLGTVDATFYAAVATVGATNANATATTAKQQATNGGNNDKSKWTAPTKATSQEKKQRPRQQ